jgi:hypothetical protein
MHDNDMDNAMENNPVMFETTNQSWSVLGWSEHLGYQQPTSEW